MFIKELFIYGYGKFEQFHMKLEPFTLIYGKNEAGKSTIMSYIHSILFGFPLKQQPELRYEPKTNSKYGGQLVLEDTNWGIVRIERVKGKATGDVTVKLDDGTIGGEELLQTILEGMDKNTYQSIYSFDIHGLQNIQKIKGEELGKFLFSTSAIGTERIMEADLWLGKEMERLFKPNGSKPELNIQLARMKDIDKRLKEAKEKIANYETLLKNSENIQNQLNYSRNRLHLIQQEIMDKREWNQIYPLIVQRKDLENKLYELGEITFPNGGVNRYEKLISELKTIKKRMVPLNEELEKIEDELKKIEIDVRITENKDQIQFIIDDLPDYRQDTNRLKELNIQLEQIENDILQIKTKLNFQGSIEEIHQFDLSFAKKDEIIKLVKKQSYLLETKKALEKNEIELEHKIKQQEAFVQGLEKDRLSQEERIRLEKILKFNQDRSNLENELKWITSQLSFLKSQSSGNKNGNISLLLFLIPILFTAFALFWLGYIQIGIGVLSASFLFFIIQTVNKRKNNGKVTSEVVNNLLVKKEQLEKKLNELPVTLDQLNQAKEKLEKDHHTARQEELEKIRLDQLEKQFNQLVTNFEKWESEWRTVEQRFIQIGRSYSLPEYMAKNHLLDSFGLIEDLKKRLDEKSRVLNQLNFIQSKLNDRKSFLLKYEQILPFFSKNYEENVLLLKTELHDQISLLNYQSEKEHRKNELLAQLSMWNAERSQVEQEIKTLFQQANVGTEDDFYTMGEKAKKREQLTNELELVNKQLAKTGKQIQIVDDNLPSYVDDATFNDLETLKNSIVQEIEKFEKERLAIQHEISIIEEDGTYTELLHQYHQDQFELEQLAKKWAVFKTAQFVLQKGMEKYKLERLPQLLVQASQYFSFITKGEYKQVFLDKERDQLLLERKDGMIFSPEEVSQSTGEQLYISLRFALAVLSNDKKPFPIIIDDGFVHFDEERRNQMMSLLKDISAHAQILLFSCHKMYTNFFDEKNTIYLHG